MNIAINESRAIRWQWDCEWYKKQYHSVMVVLLLDHIHLKGILNNAFQSGVLGNESLWALLYYKLHKKN